MGTASRRTDPRPCHAPDKQEHACSDSFGNKLIPSAACACRYKSHPGGHTFQPIACNMTLPIGRLRHINHPRVAPHGKLLLGPLAALLLAPLLAQVPQGPAWPLRLTTSSPQWPARQDSTTVVVKLEPGAAGAVGGSVLDPLAPGALAHAPTSPDSVLTSLVAPSDGNALARKPLSRSLACCNFGSVLNSLGAGGR